MNPKSLFLWNRSSREEKNPSVLRRLFVSILVFNPVSLEYVQEVDEAHLPQTDIYDDFGQGVTNPQRSRVRADSMYKELNAEQKYAFNSVVDGIIEENNGGSYFIQGSGGTGKTRLITALYHRLIGAGHKISCVAHTGIAAMLLPFGSTSHRAFFIPLTVEENMHANVYLERPEAEELKKITVVFWDEATMTDRRIFSCVDRLMRQLHPENEGMLFGGGIPFILGGDWKQTLPIVLDVRGEGVVQYTLLGSDLWNQVEVLKLNTNMRAQGDPNFAKYITQIGDGAANLDENIRTEDQVAELPSECLVSSEAKLIEKMFGTIDTPEKKKAVLKLIDSPLHEFYSIDEHSDNLGFTALDPEVYHMHTPSGKPPHKLQLKLGAVVILLRNMNTNIGLANGTRLVIEKIGKEVIYAAPLFPRPRTPKLVAIQRYTFSPTTAPTRETSFTRTQFPLRLAFCITCNRAQGQTLTRAGLILRTPCFSHGQLYVALSRVRTVKDLLIYNAADNPFITNNVVYRSALI